MMLTMLLGSGVISSTGLHGGVETAITDIDGTAGGGSVFVAKEGAVF